MEPANLCSRRRQCFQWCLRLNWWICSGWPRLTHALVPSSSEWHEVCPIWSSQMTYPHPLTLSLWGGRIRKRKWGCTIVGHQFGLNQLSVEERLQLITCESGQPCPDTGCNVDLGQSTGKSSSSHCFSYMIRCSHLGPKYRRCYTL